MNDRDLLLKKLSAYAFAAYDWNLYLDTHPNDAQAITMFKKMSNKAAEFKKEFEAKYGPLTASAVVDENRWNWIDNPWPWDNY